jgi:hypothetical protein
MPIRSLVSRISGKHWLLVIGYWLFADSRDFGLGGPDRCPEDAGKLTIFLDEVLGKGGRDHPIANRQ